MRKVSVYGEENTFMSKIMKRLVLISMVVIGLTAVSFIIDMVLGVPYSKRIVMDVLLLICSAFALYMAYETYQDLV